MFKSKLLLDNPGFFMFAPSFHTPEGGGGIPTPNEAGIPLVQGLDPEWNDIVNYVPEDKRPEFASKFQEKVTPLKKTQEEFAPWQDFAKSGLQPDQVQLAVDVLSQIETNPRLVYDSLGTYLGISPQEAQELVEEAQEEQEEQGGSGQGGEVYDDGRISRLESQLDTLAQIAVSKHEEEQIAKEEAQLDKDLTELKEKYGDFDEREIIMRMHANEVSAEEAFQDYQTFVDNIRTSKVPRPRVLGGGGTVPQPSIDPAKLNDRGRRDLVAQMLEASQQ